MHFDNKSKFNQTNAKVNDRESTCQYEELFKNKRIFDEQLREVILENRKLKKEKEYLEKKLENTLLALNKNNIDEKNEFYDDNVVLEEKRIKLDEYYEVIDKLRIQINQSDQELKNIIKPKETKEDYKTIVQLSDELKHLKEENLQYRDLIDILNGKIGYVDNLSAKKGLTDYINISASMIEGMIAKEKSLINKIKELKYKLKTEKAEAKDIKNHLNALNFINEELNKIKDELKHLESCNKILLQLLVKHRNKRLTEINGPFKPHKIGFSHFL